MLERLHFIVGLFFALNLILIIWHILPKETHMASTAILKSAPLEVVYNKNYRNNMSKVWKTDDIQQIMKELHAGKHLLAKSDNGNETTPNSTLNSTGKTSIERLIDLTDFKYRIQQNSCSNQIQALILVHSSPENFEKRSLIRNTWANKELLHMSPLRVIFLFGVVQNDDLQLKLELENLHYADIIQGSFVDSYRNMTYKHVMAFKWFQTYCAQAQLLIKVDDDVFINTPQLLKYASYTENNKSDKNLLSLFSKPENLIFCYIYTNSTVKRTFRSKWRVSFREFNEPQYPPYCMGYAIIYSKDIVLRLYSAAQKSRYFWIDDVHITGILTRLYNIKLKSSEKYFLSDDDCQKLLTHQKNLNEIDFIFSSYKIPINKFKFLWKLFPESQLYTNLQRTESSSLIPSLKEAKISV